MSYQPWTRLNGALTAVALGIAAVTVMTAQQDLSKCEPELLHRISVASGTTKLMPYRITRTYSIVNERLGQKADMTVRVLVDGPRQRTIDVLKQSGSESMRHRVFDKLLEAERNAARDQQLQITPENYEFKLLGRDLVDGNACYVFSINPKKRSKYAVQGKVWVHARDLQIVKLDGRTAERVSLFIGRPKIEQSYRKVGNVWLMSTNRCIAESTLFGTTELFIRTIDIDHSGAGGLLALAE